MSKPYRAAYMGRRPGKNWDFVKNLINEAAGHAKLEVEYVDCERITRLEKLLEAMRAQLPILVEAEAAYSNCTEQYVSDYKSWMAGARWMLSRLKGGE